MSSQSLSHVQKSFLKYQHILVFIAPLLFLVSVFTMAPTPSGAGMEYWLQYWWLFPVFLTGATIVNTVGISGSALFVPFLIFIFPIFAHPLDSSTLVKVGLISEAFGLSSSAVAFIQYGLVDRRLALTLVGGSIPFVVGGALLSFVIPDVVFHALLGIALLAASYLLFNADLGHDEPGSSDSDHAAATDGGTVSASLPNDPGKLGPAGVHTADDGTVTRVDREGDDYTYTRGGYLRRFANYSVGGMFQGLAGFGVGELGIISMLSTKRPRPRRHRYEPHRGRADRHPGVARPRLRRRHRRRSLAESRDDAVEHGRVHRPRDGSRRPNRALRVERAGD